MQGEPCKPPATRSTSQKYQSIVTRKFTSQKLPGKFTTKIPDIGKCSGTPMFYTTAGPEILVFCGTARQNFNQFSIALYQTLNVQ